MDTPYKNSRKHLYGYCIRCGKRLSIEEMRYSKDDPDREEPMCQTCYERFEEKEE